MSKLWHAINSNIVNTLLGLSLSAIGFMAIVILTFVVTIRTDVAIIKQELSDHKLMTRQRLDRLEAHAMQRFADFETQLPPLVWKTDRPDNKQE